MKSKIKNVTTWEDIEKQKKIKELAEKKKQEKKEREESQLSSEYYKINTKKIYKVYYKDKNGQLLLTKEKQEELDNLIDEAILNKLDYNEEYTVFNFEKVIPDNVKGIYLNVLKKYVIFSLKKRDIKAFIYQNLLVVFANQDITKNRYNFLKKRFIERQKLVTFTIEIFLIMLVTLFFTLMYYVF